MQKTVVRQSLIRERLSLSEKESSEKSLIIEQNFLETELYRAAESIALYSSFKGEVRTDLLLRSALSEGKRVFMPVIGKDDYSITFVSLFSEEEMIINDYGIREPDPEKGMIVELSGIDLFVVPGVGFDLHGRRLGMGKGYYDRVLKDVEKRSIVALAYEFQLLNEVPACSHDVRVGWVITEERIVEIPSNNNISGG